MVVSELIESIIFIEGFYDIKVITYNYFSHVQSCL